MTREYERARRETRFPLRAMLVAMLGVTLAGCVNGLPRPPSAASRTAGETRTTALAATDLRGGDYRAMRARDLTTCRVACVRDSRCRAYSYFIGGDGPGGQTCFLKARVPAAVQREGVISGRRLLAGGPRVGTDL